MLEPTSTPGYPWVQLGNSNAECFGYVPGLGYVGDKVADLYQAVRQRLYTLETTPKIDNIFLFIKQEPHKPAKAQQRRWRLISGIGATDQLIAEMLFRPFLDEMTNNPCRYGMAVGWAPVLENAIPFIMSHLSGLTVCADKSAWDWTVQPWLCDYMKSFLSKLCPGVSTVVQNHVEAVMGKKTFQWPGGKYHWDKRGVFCSGWKLTITGNSIMQHACHRMAGGTGNMQANGDDTCQAEEPPEYWENLRKLGPIIKEIRRDGTIEFCGLEITPDGYYPMYGAKHTFVLTHLKPKIAREVLLSYQYLYPFEPEKLAAIQAWIASLGFEKDLTPPEVLRGVPLGVI